MKEEGRSEAPSSVHPSSSPFPFLPPSLLPSPSSLFSSRCLTSPSFLYPTSSPSSLPPPSSLHAHSSSSVRYTSSPLPPSSLLTPSFHHPASWFQAPSSSVCPPSLFISHHQSSLPAPACRYHLPSFLLTPPPPCSPLPPLTTSSHYAPSPCVVPPCSLLSLIPPSAVSLLSPCSLPPLPSGIPSPSLHCPPCLRRPSSLRLGFTLLHPSSWSSSSSSPSLPRPSSVLPALPLSWSLLSTQQYEDRRRGD